MLRVLHTIGPTTRAEHVLYPRIIGLETEYGCLVADSMVESRVIRAVRDWIFEEARYGLIDIHERGWDEPAGNGGFLFNGGRVYLDMGHIEYCTPECATLVDLVRYDQAGDSILLKAVQALGYGNEVTFVRNNIDHFTDATFGCHENYLIDRMAPLSEKNVLSLLTFQTLRVLFTGAGRVGAAVRVSFSDLPTEERETVPFQISQRADYIETEFFQWVQHSRAIINTRDQPLADPNRFRRLHVLHGDTNVLPAASYLKVGATSLVLDLLETNNLPDISLHDAVSTLRLLSYTVEPPWMVVLSSGRTVDALDLLEEYFDLAHREFHSRDEQTDHVLALWRRVLDGLHGAPSSLVGILDWVSKKYLLEEFIAAEDLDWSDPWVASQDLEFHQIDPARSLGLAIAEWDGPWRAVDDRDWLLHPPTDSRAGRRGRLMREYAQKERVYWIDWDRLELPDGRSFVMTDPFRA